MTEVLAEVGYGSCREGCGVYYRAAVTLEYFVSYILHACKANSSSCACYR